MTAILALGLIACGGDDGGDEPSEPETLTSQEVFQQGKKGTVQIQVKSPEGEFVGTGIVYDLDRKLLLTNAHVVDGATAIKVRYAEEPATPARVLGSSFCNDLAVVEMVNVPDGLQELPLGNSETVRNQDEVTALGYPVNLSEDLDEQGLVSTSGTVNSPEVAFAPDESVPRFPSLIQHDATINGGNSGGPLFNDQGEVIGINTYGNDENENEFYAITVNQAKDQLANLEKGKSPDDIGWDIQPFSQVPLSEVYPAAGYATASVGVQEDRLLAQNDITGIWVWGSTPGKPAEEANLFFGDLITDINDQPVASVQDVCDILQSTSPGQKLQVGGRYVLSGDASNHLDEWQTEMTMPK